MSKQGDGMQSHRLCDDHDQAPVADLVTMAERAMDDVTAPVLSRALDLRQHIDDPGGG